MYYHLRLTLKSDITDDEVKLDFAKEDIQEKIVNPYLEGRQFVVNGRIIEPENVHQIRINCTAEPSSNLLPQIDAERRSGRIRAPGISDEWYVTKKGKDVTDDFINRPPKLSKNDDKPQVAEKKNLPEEKPRVVVNQHIENMYAPQQLQVATTNSTQTATTTSTAEGQMSIPKWLSTIWDGLLKLASIQDPNEKEKYSKVFFFLGVAVVIIAGYLPETISIAVFGIAVSFPLKQTATTPLVGLGALIVVFSGIMFTSQPKQKKR